MSGKRESGLTLAGLRRCRRFPIGRRGGPPDRLRANGKSGA